MGEREPARDLGGRQVRIQSDGMLGRLRHQVHPLRIRRHLMAEVVRLGQRRVAEREVGLHLDGSFEQRDSQAGIRLAVEAIEQARGP